MSHDAGGVTRVVCAQIAPVVGDLEGNVKRVLKAVHRSLSDHADVIILPELSTSGYVFDSADEARSVALTQDDEFFHRLAATLRETETIVVLGFCEQGPGDTLWNSAALVDATGVVSVYRKTHLWDRESMIFTHGDNPAPVIETAHGRIGVLICYDLEFAEMPRALALAGADLIVVPTNWPLGEHPTDERAAEIIYAQAAARANGVFIACCDRSGIERGQTWIEGSVIIDQFGWVRAAATHGGRTTSATNTVLLNDEPRATADVFLRLSRDKSISPHNDLLRDRRPDLYAKGTA